jgi:DNA processing protein
MEAALRSGTLLTAQYAAEQGREVFVVPGHPLDPRSAGGNALIRDGAALVQNPTDILDVYASLPGLACPPSCQRSPQLSLSLGEQQSAPPTDLPEKVLASLSLTPVRVDELAAQLRVSASFVRAALVEIEIAGYLDRQTGDYVCRLPTVDG